MRVIQALCRLKMIKYVCLNLDLKEISDATYETILWFYQCFKKRKAEFSLSLNSCDIDGKVSKRLHQLPNQIHVFN